MMMPQKLPLQTYYLNLISSFHFQIFKFTYFICVMRNLLKYFAMSIYMVFIDGAFQESFIFLYDTLMFSFSLENNIEKLGGFGIIKSDKR